MRNREMIGKEIWNRLLKAEDGTLRNLYLATYSLDQGVLWWIADTLSKNPQCTGKYLRISCVYDGARLRRWKRDVDDQAGGQQKVTCFSARTQKLYHPKVIVADYRNTWKALIGTGNLSSGESEQERNFGVLIESAVSGAANARNGVTASLRQLAGNIGLRPPKRAGAGGSATGSPEPSSCFLVVERSDGGYQVRCEQASLTKVFGRLLEKHVVPSDSSNDLCVVICSPFGISRKTFKDVFGGREQNGRKRKILLQLFTRKDVAPQSFPVEAYVHHPVGTAGLHGKLVFVAARDGHDRTTEVTGDGILFIGSANFTKKAWGKGKKNEENVETGVVIVDEAKKLKRAVEYLLDGRWSYRPINKKNADDTDDDYGDIDSEEEKYHIQIDALKRGLLAQCLEVNADRREVHVTKKEVNPEEGVRCRIKDVLLCNSRGESVNASGNRIPILYKIQDCTLNIRLSTPRNWPSEVEIPLCAVRGAEGYSHVDALLEKLLSPGGRCVVGGRGKRRQPAKSGESSDGAPSDDVRFPWDALCDLIRERRKDWKHRKHISEIENRLREEAERLAAGTHAKQSPENVGHRKREHTSGSASQHPPQRSYQKYQPYLRMYIIKKVLEAWQSSTKNGGACRSQ